MPLATDRVETRLPDLKPALTEAQARAEAARCLFCHRILGSERQDRTDQGFERAINRMLGNDSHRRNFPSRNLVAQDAEHCL